MKQAGLEEAAKHADCCVDREELTRLRQAYDERNERGGH